MQIRLYVQENNEAEPVLLGVAHDVSSLATALKTMEAGWNSLGTVDDPVEAMVELEAALVVQVDARWDQPPDAEQ